jgi:hypothetical protein
MDDFYIPRALNCCGVALKSKFLTSVFDPNQVTRRLGPEDQYLKRYVGRVFTNGTCFVLSKAKSDIYIGGKKVLAFALTNYHVAYDVPIKQKHQILFVDFPSEDGKIPAYPAQVLTEFYSKFDCEQYSSSGIQYCLPNDIAILVIYQRQAFADNDADINMCVDLLEIPFANDDELLSLKACKREAFISGYPVSASKSNYILPDSNGIENVVRKIQEGFHGFEYQVISEGTVSITDTGLAQLELSTTSGMPGSPILIGTWPDIKLCGIYCGGPPLPGQRELMQVIDNAYNDRFEQAYSLFMNLPFHDSTKYNFDDEYRIGFINQLLQQLISLKEAEKRAKEINERRPDSEEETKSVLKSISQQALVDSKKEKVNEACFNLLFETPVTYLDKEIFKFNAGIAVCTQVFDKVKSAQKALGDFVGSYSDINQLEQELLKMIYPVSSNA